MGCVLGGIAGTVLRVVSGRGQFGGGLLDRTLGLTLIGITRLVGGRFFRCLVLVVEFDAFEYNFCYGCLVDAEALDVVGLARLPGLVLVLGWLIRWFDHTFQILHRARPKLELKEKSWLDVEMTHLVLNISYLEVNLLSCIKQ